MPRYLIRRTLLALCAVLLLAGCGGMGGAGALDAGHKAVEVVAP